jgi:hypothetical protein
MVSDRTGGVWTLVSRDSDVSAVHIDSAGSVRYIDAGGDPQKLLAIDRRIYVVGGDRITALDGGRALPATPGSGLMPSIADRTFGTWAWADANMIWVSTEGDVVRHQTEAMVTALAVWAGDVFYVTDSQLRRYRNGEDRLVSSFSTQPQWHVAGSFLWAYDGVTAVAMDESGRPTEFVLSAIDASICLGGNCDPDIQLQILEEAATTTTTTTLPVSQVTTTTEPPRVVPEISVTLPPKPESEQIEASTTVPPTPTTDPPTTSTEASTTSVLEDDGEINTTTTTTFAPAPPTATTVSPPETAAPTTTATPPATTTTAPPTTPPETEGEVSEPPLYSLVLDPGDFGTVRVGVVGPVDGPCGAASEAIITTDNVDRSVILAPSPQGTLEDVTVGDPTATFIRLTVCGLSAQRRNPWRPTVSLETSLTPVSTERLGSVRATAVIAAEGWSYTTRWILLSCEEGSDGNRECTSFDAIVTNEGRDAEWSGLPAGEYGLSLIVPFFRSSEGEGVQHDESRESTLRITGATSTTVEPPESTTTVEPPESTTTVEPPESTTTVEPPPGSSG